MRTGLVRWEWHSLDHVGASESEVEAPTDTTPWDWFHLNSIDPEPDGDILISARSTWAGYQLQGGSGKVLWRLGGNSSSFKMGPGHEDGLAARRAHAARRRGHLLRRRLQPADPPPVARPCGSRSTSRPTKPASPPPTRTPTRRCSPPARATCRRSPDGNAVVGYGGVPAISEYAADGSLLFDAHLPLDMSFYRAFRFPWSGAPAEPAGGRSPASTTPAKRRSCTRAGTAPPTWPPGACSPASTPDRSTAQATIPASGFESSTTLPEKYAYVAVQALDSAGRVLGTSRTVQAISYAASLPSSGAGGTMLSRPVWRCACAWSSGRGRGAARRRLGGRARPLCRRTRPLRQWPPGRPASVSMAVSGVLLIGRAPIVARGRAHPTRRSRRSRWQLMSVERRRLKPAERAERQQGSAGLAAGRLLRGAVHGHPRPEHRQRRAALDPVEPRLLLARPAVGRRRLRDHVRRLPDARRPRGRPLRAAPDVRRWRCSCSGSPRWPAAPRPTSEVLIGARAVQGFAGALMAATLAGDHHRVVRARAEAPPRDRRVGGDERARRRRRRAARRDHHRSAQLALGPADQPPDRDRGRARRLRGRDRAPQGRDGAQLRPRRRADADDRADGARVRGRRSGPEGLGHVRRARPDRRSASSCSRCSA